MSLEKLENMASLVLGELINRAQQGYDTVKVNVFPELEAKFKNLMRVAQENLPEHQELFEVAYNKINVNYHPLEVRDAISLIHHLLAILNIEKSSETKIKAMKIFESAEEKLKQAALSFRKDDYTSAFHNLNSALELILKDKLGIPTTITKINTSSIINVWVKHKVESHLFLAEAKKRVLMIDNKIKHQGYSPSKIDCINGIKVMEELISRLRNKEVKLTKVIRKKIYEGL